MSKLGDIAKKTVGAQAMSIENIIEQFGGVVTINGLSYTEYKGSQIPVFSFVEGDGCSFWGGCKKLRELPDAWIEACGDLRSVNEELSTEGVRIKLSPKPTTKGGILFRPVAVLGTVKFDDCDCADFDSKTGEVLNSNPVADPF